ncbi:MAG: hypothetical protein EB054_05620 [Actinobacteria bacterium]|nr:hypothetical protein [Actinomycetota bacterium]
MKIKVSITREFDTTGDDHADLFDGVVDPVTLAKHYLTDDIYSLVTDNAVEESITVEVVA